MVGASSQRAFAFDAHDAETYLAAIWGRVLELIRAESARMGHKAFAGECDESPSVWAHMLAERNRHEVKGRHVVVALYHAAKNGDMRLLEQLASVSNHEVVPVKEMTPEEELAALKTAMDQTLSTDVRALLLEKAKRVRR
jgi:hypothetical protein